MFYNFLKHTLVNYILINSENEGIKFKLYGQYL